MYILSIDMEATGLRPDDLMIEFAAIPFNTESCEFEKSLSFHRFIKCPSYEQLESSLDQWVRDHNRELITKAAEEGLGANEFKKQFGDYLQSPEFKKIFPKKALLFGKSLSALDLPFMTRDLGNDFMREHFEHKNLDLTSVAYCLGDMGLLPKGLDSSKAIMKYFNKGEVCHTALEDAVNTAEIYGELLNLSLIHI